MCGINGIVNFNEKIDLNRLSIMNDHLIHRGPDRGDTWISNNGFIGFGHRRLSILDLSDKGNQPMIDDANGNIIILNGEIYNFNEIKAELIENDYIFNSLTDTEVILKAYNYWGNDCLSKLDGMFSFAIYNLNKNCIFFARDRAGEKPFFYKYTKNNFIFSSELKAIIKTSNENYELNKSAADCYFGMGFTPGDMCIIDKMNKLPPGYALELDCNDFNLNIWKYWHPPKLQNNRNPSKDYNMATKTKELECLLSNSVKKQLVSDVPIGILLSGGVDSSLITALASRHKKNIKTFTVVFPNNQKYNESQYAKLISKEFCTEHIELEAKNINPRDLLPCLAKQYDEPIIDSSMIPTFMISKLVKEHCTVVLGGDGGDELFGGYNHYSRLLWSQNKTKYIPSILKKPIAHIAEKFLPMGTKGKIWLQSLEFDLNKELPLIASYFDKLNRKKLINDNNWPLVSEKIRKDRVFKTHSLLERATRTDFDNYLAEDILVKTDRASMLNSLELRAPFLSDKIIEFAFELNSSMKTSQFEKKIILQELCKNVLPSKFISNRKQGFAIPLNEWLKDGIWLNYFKEVLLDYENNLFDLKYLEKLFISQKKGYQLGERIYSLVMFKLWLREYNIKI